MKQHPILYTLGASILCLFLMSCNRPHQQTKKHETITISGAFALYPMAVKWAEEYRKLHPDVKIDISAGGAGKGIVDALAHSVDLGMVSRDISKAEIDKGVWWVSVTKDAVVPVVNEQNPVWPDIKTKGISKKMFGAIWIAQSIKTWGQVVHGKNNQPVNVYTRSDACGAAQTWAEFFGKKQEDLPGTGVYGDPGVAEAVVKDAFGIGYNNVGYAYDSKTKAPVKGLRVVPVDLDENGVIDSTESFYDSRDQLTAAIASGKYPSPPARNLHFASGGKPQKEEVLKFLAWVLTDGQKFIDEAGFVSLPREKINLELEKLK